MNENEILLVLEEFRIRIEKLEKNSHPPVKWESIINKLAKRVSKLSKKIGGV
jgi:hypothetical protein